MSTKMIPTPTSTVVCDLCGKPLDTYSNEDRCNLAYGTTPLQRTPRPRWYVFTWDWWGGRKQRPTDHTNDLYAQRVDWDFHGECLVRALRPLVAERLSVSTESSS